jgi:hypothetical protein
VAGAAHIAVAQAGPAINQFEVKDLEVEIGRWEFQSQNAFSWNQPERRAVEVAPDEFIFDDNSVVQQRYALEIEYGLTKRFRTRLGIEFEQERIDDPPSFEERDDFDAIEFEELAIEGVLVLLPVRGKGVGLGLLGEYQYTLEASDADSFVFGPIIEAAGERWSMVLNPAVVKFFNGEDGDDKLDFSYGLQVAYEWSEKWLLAAEAYGTVERLGSSGTPSEEAELFGDHNLLRLGPIGYFRHSSGDDREEREFRLGVGLFAGATRDTPDWTFKLSIEYEF